MMGLSESSQPCVIACKILHAALRMFVVIDANDAAEFEGLGTGPFLT